MEIVFKHTDQLTKDELEGIVTLFEEIFDKIRSKEFHLRQFTNNPLGYSYHSIIINEGKIVGVNTYVPVYYVMNGEKVLFANSIDSMVKKGYRDFFAYNDMVTKAYREMRKEGVKFVYGYPNDNAYPVVIKSKLMKDIGRMNTYCLPIHIGGIKPSLSFLNPLTELISRLYVSLMGFLASSKNSNFLIYKHESYNDTRYQRGDADYSMAKLDNGLVVYYKIKEHDGVRTAFLIDISEKSPKSFNMAVRHILKNHRKNFDLLLYPGFLYFENTSMIRIPRKFEPKNFNFTGKILDKDVIGDEIWDIRNWDTNLSNYDLI